MMNDLPNADLYATIRKVAQRGGAVFYDRVPAGTANATATGTGTSRTSITTSYSIPNAARELLAIAPALSSTADAAADIKFAFADIQGTSFKRQPQQVLAPIGSVTLSVGSTRFTPQEWYKVCAPVSANDQYDWGITPYVANAHNMKAWVDVMYSTIPSGDPTIFSQCQTSKTAFLAAGSTSTGTLTLTNANSLYEVATGVSGEAAAVANENQILSNQLQCSALQPIQTFIYGQDAPAQITATSGDTQLPQISRYLTAGLSFTIPSPLLTYTSILDVATSNNLNVAHMARYTSF